MATTSRKKPAAKKKAAAPAEGKPIEAPAIPEEVADDAAKTRAELQAKIGEFIIGVLPELFKSFDELPTLKKWDYLVDLLPFATPKMAAADMGATGMPEDSIASQIKALSNSLKSKQ